MHHVWSGLGLACAVTALSSIALADPAPATRPVRRGEITVETVEIKQRVPRPMAVVDISRVSTRVALPQRPFSPVGRIETATGRAPF